MFKNINHPTNLTIRKFFYVIYLTVTISNFFNLNSALGSVDHKTAELSSYLDQISENQNEKADPILSIIKKCKSGTYLDIGSGRDTIPHIIDNIPKNAIDHITLIAADLEAKTLAEIAKRYPELHLGIDSRNKIKLSLLKMDATEMHPIQDSSVKTINASSVLHEVNSYVPYKNPIDRFFWEAIRVMEKEGFLIYRDPTLQDNPDISNKLVLKNDLAKKFTVIFLAKFLDNKLSEMIDMYGNSIKPDFGYQNNFTIKFFASDDIAPTTLNYKEFFAYPTNNIDFSKDITINAPRRLLSEIQRHYVLFIKDVYPMAFLDNVGSDLVKDFAQNSVEVQKTIGNYVKSLGLDLNKNLNKHDLKKITMEIRKIDSLLRNGAYFRKLDDSALNSIKTILEENKVSDQLYKIINNKDLWLDAKLLFIMYNRFSNLFNQNFLPIESIKWVQREGEEYYFYFTTKQLLAYLERFCGYYLKGTDKENYVLTPVENGGIQYSTRDLYKQILERDMQQTDNTGAKQEFVTSKTTIIFQLKPSGKKGESAPVLDKKIHSGKLASKNFSGEPSL